MTEETTRERALAAICDDIEQAAKERTLPVETGGLKRKMHTGDLGMPIWLQELLAESGWDTPYVECIELGGRGVKHPTTGWVSIDELRELADDD